MCRNLQRRGTGLQEPRPQPIAAPEIVRLVALLRRRRGGDGGRNSQSGPPVGPADVAQLGCARPTAPRSRLWLVLARFSDHRVP